MSKLEHISKYLNEFQAELDLYDEKLTEAAENITLEVKEIQQKLSQVDVDKFSYFWSVEEKDTDLPYSLSAGLSWTGKKVMFHWEDEDPEALLGANRRIRVAAGKNLIPFLEKGLSRTRDKVKELY